MGVSDYLGEKRKQLTARLSRLEAEASRYETLMKLSDRDLMLHRTNEKALAEDPVYISPAVSETLKEAIRTRTAGGLLDIEGEYKRVLYGISAENKNHLVLVSDAEGTPIQFDPIFLRKVGYKNHEMADLCRRYALDEDGLLKLQDYETQYGIVFKPLANLLPKGYSIDDVGVLLQVRQALLAKDSRVSLDMVVRFREKFKDMETEAGLADWISLAHDGLKLGSIDASVTRLLDKATELRTNDFDIALEAAKQPDPKRPPWG